MLGSDLISFLRPGSSCEGFYHLHCGRDTSTVSRPIVAFTNGNTGIILFGIILAIILMLMLVLAIFWLFPERFERARTRLRGYVGGGWEQCRSSFSSLLSRLRQVLPGLRRRSPPSPTPPAPPPPTPVRPERSRRVTTVVAHAHLPVIQNPPDFRLEQALEQQRQILSRFRELQGWIQRLEGRIDWLQNRFLELKNAQERQGEDQARQRAQLIQQQVPPLPQLQPRPPPQLQPVEPNFQSPASPPPLQAAPAPLVCQPQPTPVHLPQHQQQLREEDILTEDEDGEAASHRVQPCRQCKLTNPCYLRETVSFSGKKIRRK
ncbi:unnamed protein product [Allacma fusca]|uniref:Uncharacterized protein n=1 Tax=Allacma fusca TaxID=39272 RepID=A0A8J2KW06_9HEXA|nr:unnamed protein product [Allacma fusca]